MRILTLLWTVSAALAMQAGVNGTWEIAVPGRPTGLLFELKTDGAKLTGSVQGPNGRLEIANASVAGDEVRFDVVTPVQGRTITTTFTGRVVEDELRLTATAMGVEQKMVAKRRAADAGPPDWFSAPPAPAEVTAWLRANAIPLKRVEPAGPLDDMAPLKARLKDARIVAMGEATHGTREFQQFKHRMFRFLVEELGFTVFAIESSWATGRRIDDYVQGKIADASEALTVDSLYNWWETDDFTDLVEWMRAYNQNPAHTRKVKFAGFDIRSVRLLERQITEYLTRVDPSRIEQAQRLFAELQEPEMPAYRNAGDEVHRRVVDGLAALLRRFDDAKDTYIRASNPRDWAVARQSVVVLQQSEAKGRLPGDEGSASRDRSMAENLKWILDQEPAGAKAMLWAHNEHVAAEPWNFPRMGTHLRRFYGAGMAVCGFVFAEGGFRAFPGNESAERNFAVGPPPRGSLDATLAGVGPALFAIDLRPATGAVAEWLDAPHISRQIGAEYSDATAPAYFQQLPARKAFDLIVFVGKTTPIRRW